MIANSEMTGKPQAHHMNDNSKTNDRIISGAKPRLTLKELRHVWFLNQTLNFNRAATSAGISQSALSQSIANIEQRLGVALFRRDRRNVFSTSFGLIVANHAETVLHSLEDMDKHIEATRDSREGSVAFGMGIFVVNHLLSPVLTQFHQRYPEIRLNCTAADIPSLQDQLTRGEIQFFVGGRNPEYRDKSQVRELLYREQLVVAARPKHPLRTKASIGIVELIHFPAITYDGSYLRRQIDQRLTHAEEFELLERNCPAIELQQPWLLADFVNTSNHLIIASRTALRDWLTDGRLMEIDVNDLDMSLDVELTYNKDSNLPPANQRIIEIIKEVVSSQDLHA